ncbi:MAG: hypothetical protein V7720_00680 [Halioglobus sp.]
MTDIQQAKASLRDLREKQAAYMAKQDELQRYQRKTGAVLAGLCFVLGVLVVMFLGAPVV